MNDDSGSLSGERPPEIDARSPAERWAEAGRANSDRARVLVERGRVDLAGLGVVVAAIAWRVAGSRTSIVKRIEPQIAEIS